MHLVPSDPRRRLVVAAALAVLLIAVVAVAVPLLRGGGGPDRTGGGRAAPGPRTTTGTTPQPTASPTADGGPFAGDRFYLNPDTLAAQAARRASAQGDTADAALYQRIAGQPTAVWLNGDAGDAAQARSTVSAAQTQHAVPTLVLYHVPQRDCGSFSSGGAETFADYQDWVSGIAAAIGSRPAAVILEPDAISSVSCLSDSELGQRLDNLAQAVRTLRDHSDATVYLAAPDWLPLDQTVSRLRRAGVEDARGFALNVSNFKWNSEMTAFGDRLAATLGGAHYVVDTSRNGKGPAGGRLAWCNPSGRGLGHRPTTDTGHSAADAFLYIKTPGVSDGTCDRGEPEAGDWYPSYALGLARRSQLGRENP